MTKINSTNVPRRHAAVSSWWA